MCVAAVAKIFRSTSSGEQKVQEAKGPSHLKDGDEGPEEGVEVLAVALSHSVRKLDTELAAEQIHAQDTVYVVQQENRP